MTQGKFMDRNQLAKALFEASHLTGRFKLRSGTISDEYFDKYQFEARPDLLRAIGQELAKMIPKGTEVLGGLEMGGIPLATAVAFETGLPMVFIRKEAKDYGTCRLAEGPDVAGRKICLIEDVITTGGAVIDATRELRKEGAIIEEVVCVIYRGHGPAQNLIDIDLKYSPLFTMEELKTHA
jgi:orotate phosphoribosyltransferase